MYDFPAPLGGLPLPLARALAADPGARSAFALLPRARQRELIRRAQRPISGDALRALVRALAP